MSSIIDTLLDYINKNNAPGGAVFRNIKRVFPQICEEIEATQPGRCWTEKLYRYTHPSCIDVCKMCNIRLIYRDWQFGFRTYCSIACKTADQEFVNNRVKETFIQNYGVDNPMKCEHVRDKLKQTLILELGVDNAAKHPGVQTKMKSTNLIRYGVENTGQKNSPFRSQIDETRTKTMKDRYGVSSAFKIPGVMDQRRGTWVDKYGESHPHKCAQVRAKYTETIQSKWGVDHPMQDADVLDKCVKSAKKSKKYVFPSGKEIMVQGYEPQALDVLLSEGIQEHEIINLRTDMPKLWYVNDKNKKSRYYPDFYIPGLNLLVEVKSEYTAQIRPDLIEKKKQAVLDAGYQYRLMILKP